MIQNLNVNLAENHPNFKLRAASLFKTILQQTLCYRSRALYKLTQQFHQPLFFDARAEKKARELALLKAEDELQQLRAKKK